MARVRGVLTKVALVAAVGLGLACLNASPTVVNRLLRRAGSLRGRLALTEGSVAVIVIIVGVALVLSVLIPYYIRTLIYLQSVRLEVTEHQRLLDALEAERRERMQSFGDVIAMGKSLASTFNQQGIFRIILHHFRMLTRWKASDSMVALLLFDPFEGRYKYEAGDHFDPAVLARTTFEQDDDVIRRLQAGRDIVAFRRAEELTGVFVPGKISEAGGSTAVVLAPLVFASEMLGALIALCHPAVVDQLEDKRLHIGAALGQATLALGMAIQSGLAVVDRLTRLHNRGYVLNRLEQEIERANRYGLSLSLLVIDIDDFKRVNDTYGHQQGDAVLRIVAQIILKAIRVIDVCGRYGGEEFVVLLPETGEEDSARQTGAYVVAERIRQDVADEFAGLSGPLAVTVSIGVGVRRYPRDRKMDSTQLIKAADEQLYRAKSAGKNRTCAAQSGSSRVVPDADEGAGAAPEGA